VAVEPHPVSAETCRTHLVLNAVTSVEVVEAAAVADAAVPTVSLHVPALAAVRGYLHQRRPALFVEVLPGTAQLRALLADLCATDGYRCYAMSRQGLVELAPRQLATVRLMDDFGCQDVLLAAADRPLPPLRRDPA
jgi:hypothetical protein